MLEQAKYTGGRCRSHCIVCCTLKADKSQPHWSSMCLVSMQKTYQPPAGNEKVVYAESTLFEEEDRNLNVSEKT